MEVIIKDKQKEAEIDWKKVQLLESKIDETLVLSSGEYTDTDFCGVEIGGDNHGEYSEMWSKNKFILSDKEVTLSNK